MTVDALNPRLSLQNKIKEALDAREQERTVLVDVARQTPSTLVEVLHDFVYDKDVEASASRTIIPLYFDKSRGQPFPLYCLSRSDRAQRQALHERVPVLPVALMSMRHLQMDAFVYMAWFLNRDIARCRTNADVEAFCYEQTRQQIQAGLHEDPLRLHVYQTGFPPAIVGFYRGLVAELQLLAGQPSSMLEVIPYYYAPMTQNYRQGTSWD